MNEESYIHEHLSTINFIAREFNCQNVLEIGTGDGDSTIALASAMQTTGGIVTSLDIEYKGKTYDKIYDEGLGHKVNFLVQDSLKFKVVGSFDFILVDGDHEFKTVKKEIEKYFAELQVGGFMVFHDTNNPAWEGTRQAVMNWLLDNKDYFIGLDFYEWFNCNGLLVIRKRYE